MPLGVFLAGMLWSANAFAGATIQIDDTHSVSIGAGLRGSFAALEDGTGAKNDKWSNDFNLDNARIYLSGQVHKYLKLELNTECVFCGGSGERFTVLDAIAKIELSPYFNIWGGRVLVPADRAEMDGPFYGNVYQNFKTPFYPADFSTHFGSGGAGVYNRDHGVNIWGNVGPDSKLKYVFGVFNGLRGASNTDGNALFATRVAYQFLNVEDNPAYYTSSTYYGGGGDILTLGYALQYQADGAGTAANKSDFLGMSVDGLFEKPLDGAGVFTAEAEYKHFEANYSTAAFSDTVPNPLNSPPTTPPVMFPPVAAESFNMFRGDAYTVTALYLLPDKVGIGTPQPYARFSEIDPRHSMDRNEFEAGLNYIIAGHNGKVSLFYQYGDITPDHDLTNFAPDFKAKKLNSVNLAIQVQI
ncbi:MAG: hypothetical protein ACHQ4J_11875 [Candidatus Binatia bacterium]